jgi:hypothetical protein
VQAPGSDAKPSALALELAAERLTRHDGHPFAGAREACEFCGESPGHILHHPTRIRAACLLRGIDPARLLALAAR